MCSAIEETGDNKIKVTFTDGTTATADTVVCADGIKGVGRRTLLGEEKAALSEAPCSFVNICNKYKPEQARFIRDTLDTMYKFAAHPEQPTLFMIVPVDIPDLDKPEEWKYQTCLSTWGAKHSDSNEERLRTFKNAASRYAEPWKSAVEWLPEDTWIPPDTIKYWANPEIWPNWGGKVTLAGDGAHPIVPFRAQGLNNALQDAHNYVQALVEVRDGSKTLEDAITAYGAEVLERCSAENKLSNMWGPVLHNWQAMMNTPMMKQGYGQTKKPETATEETKPTEESKEESPQAAEQASDCTLPAQAGAEAQSQAQREEKQSQTPSQHAKPTRLEPPPQAPTATLAHGQYTPTEELAKSPDLVASTVDDERDVGAMTPSSDADEVAQLKKENAALRKRNDLLLEKLKAIQSLLVVEEGEMDDA